MKIQNLPPSLQQVYKREQEAARGVEKSSEKGPVSPSVENEGAVAGGKDEATVSDDAKVFAKGAAALKDSPQVRSELVSRLKEEIDAGRYEIPYERLAERLAGLLKPQD
ncbi:MAG TPA: flagellar biosynthesis anti-sigma factor FlgM [Anaerolineales bacterium]|nr:flagellar biosynthesis anti-sigma factor FlgM [Anaerolineales bacterium]